MRYQVSDGILVFRMPGIEPDQNDNTVVSLEKEHYLTCKFISERFSNSNTFIFELVQPLKELMLMEDGVMEDCLNLSNCFNFETCDKQFPLVSNPLKDNVFRYTHLVQISSNAKGVTLMKDSKPSRDKFSNFFNFETCDKKSSLIFHPSKRNDFRLTHSVQSCSNCERVI